MLLEVYIHLYAVSCNQKTRQVFNKCKKIKKNKKIKRKENWRVEKDRKHGTRIEKIIKRRNSGGRHFTFTLKFDGWEVSLLLLMTMKTRSEYELTTILVLYPHPYILNTSKDGAAATLLFLRLLSLPSQLNFPPILDDSSQSFHPFTLFFPSAFP